MPALTTGDFPRAVRELLARTEAARLQNVLMRIPDKVCAAAFSILTDHARQRLYALVADVKALRIREEIRLEERRRTSPLVRARLLRSFLSYFNRAGAPAPKVWIRPIRRRDR